MPNRDNFKWVNQWTAVKIWPSNTAISIFVRNHRFLWNLHLCSLGSNRTCQSKINYADQQLCFKVNDIVLNMCSKISKWLCQKIKNAPKSMSASFSLYNVVWHTPFSETPKWNAIFQIPSKSSNHSFKIPMIFTTLVR